MFGKHPAPVAGPSLDSHHADVADLEELREDAESCRRCDLYRHATQIVFGEGPEDADVVLVGQQPGDREDVTGRPFIGPAGHLLDICLEEAGIDRARCYVTNAVKHFKFTPRGKRRLHGKANAGEVRSCAWWLGAEIALLEPKLVVALGATAALSLLGSKARVTRDRGRLFHLDGKPEILVTIHPSALLRMREEDDREAAREDFIEDLRKIRRFLSH